MKHGEKVFLGFLLFLSLISATTGIGAFGGPRESLNGSRVFLFLRLFCTCCWPNVILLIKIKNVLDPTTFLPLCKPYQY